LRITITFVFLELISVAEFSDADFDFCAFTGFFELVGADLCPEAKMPIYNVMAMAARPSVARPKARPKK
jgi:hypothetical protein